MGAHQCYLPSTLQLLPSAAGAHAVQEGCCRYQFYLLRCCPQAQCHCCCLSAVVSSCQRCCELLSSAARRCLCTHRCCPPSRQGFSIFPLCLCKAYRRWKQRGYKLPLSFGSCQITVNDARLICRKSSHMPRPTCYRSMRARSLIQRLIQMGYPFAADSC